MHHTPHRARDRRTGCTLCKRWKASGVRTEALQGETFCDHVRCIADEPPQCR